MIPGRSDTLRINGRARLLSDAPFFDVMIVKGHRPILALVIDIDGGLLPLRQGAAARSSCGDPRPGPTRCPPRAVIAKTFERPDDSLEELTAYYGPAYADKLYG